MDPRTVTIVSGVALLIVFLLVGWWMRRKHGPASRAPGRKDR